MRNKPNPWLVRVQALISGLWCAAAHTQTLSWWEVGVGMGALVLPYYRGADSGRTFLAPIPYLQYHSESLRVDEDGIRSYLFRSDRVKLNFSIAGSVPVPNDGNSARSGMPSLNSIVEVGPMVEALLLNSIECGRALWLKLPVRAAISVGGGNIDHQGWVLTPYLEYSVRKCNSTEPWNINFSIGPIFADKAYHDYFYEVAPAYITTTRSEYHPYAGYSGSRMTLGLQKRWGLYRLGFFARYDSLQGVTFRDSPLVQQRGYYALGIAFIKLFAVSD
jgi:MipA family protein